MSEGLSVWNKDNQLNLNKKFFFFKRTKKKKKGIKDLNNSTAFAFPAFHENYWKKIKTNN